MIIRNGTAGAIRDKVTEDMLISYLENFQDQQTTTITFKRKIDDEKASCKNILRTDDPRRIGMDAKIGSTDFRISHLRG